MEKTVIIHSELCFDPSTSVRKRCKSCFKKYRRERDALKKKEREDQIIETRASKVIKQSVYVDILCDICVDKTLKDFCQ